MSGMHKGRIPYYPDLGADILRPGYWASQDRIPEYDPGRAEAWLSNNPGLDANKWVNRILAALAAVALVLGIAFWHEYDAKPVVPHITYVDQAPETDAPRPEAYSVADVVIQMQTGPDAPWVDSVHIINPSSVGEIWATPPNLRPEQIRVVLRNYASGNIKCNVGLLNGLTTYVQVWSEPS